MFKKIICIALAGILMFSICACSNSSSGTGEEVAHGWLFGHAWGESEEETEKLGFADDIEICGYKMISKECSYDEEHGLWCIKYILLTSGDDAETIYPKFEEVLGEGEEEISVGGVSYTWDMKSDEVDIGYSLLVLAVGGVMHLYIADNAYYTDYQ